MLPMSSMKAVVKTTLIACVLAAMMPVSAGLFGSSEIKQVKSTVINSATGLTYEKFFSGYQHAKSVDWSEEIIDGGRVTAVVVTLDHKDIENFSKNVQIERENGVKKKSTDSGPKFAMNKIDKCSSCRISNRSSSGPVYCSG